MRACKFQIRTYKSILDSEEVMLDPYVTTIVGKNESGKTNILTGIESFSPSINYDKADIPLSINRNEINADSDIITIWFKVEVEDMKKLESIHPSLKNVSIIKISKNFSNQYSIDIPGIKLEELKPINNINCDEINSIYLNITALANKLKDILDENAETNDLSKDSIDMYTNIFDSIDSIDPAKVDLSTTFKSYFNNLMNMSAEDEIKSCIEDFTTEVENYIADIEDLKKKSPEIVDLILDITPDLIYFSDIELLEDTANISAFLSEKSKHKTLSNLLELAKIDVESIQEAEHYEKISKLNSASATITGLVNHSWKQENVKVQIDIYDPDIIVSIYDDINKKHHPPSMRSQGFRWFLSFYINFVAGSKGELKNTIILLDDPGVYLHPSGQKDLLNTLYEISKSNQIVFCTHSPFMIDRNNLDIIKIASKNGDNGTTINDKWYKSDDDALAPIRASLGMTIGDTLFTGKKNLIIEGYSDEILLESMSKVCSVLGKHHINLSKVSILPSNGADKVPYFASILRKENLDFVILLDYDRQGKYVANQLEEKLGINNAKILMLDKVIEAKGRNLIIEDLIDIEFYLKGVNEAYAEIFNRKLKKPSITYDDLESSSFDGIKSYFRKQKIGKSRSVDKIRVAKKISELVASDKIPNDETIEIFSKLFNMINIGLEMDHI